MPTAVVTGANSGIGHAFAQILINEGWDVHACDLTPGPALQTLQCRLHVLDVSSPTSISAFTTQLGPQTPIDLLLNVAGIMVPPANDALETTNISTLEKIFAVNTFGPLLLTQALLPNLTAQPETPSMVGIVSSRVGSIGDNSTGGTYAYRASKAAVNSIGKSMAMDLRDRGVVVSLLHPGFVRTNINTGEEPHPESVEPEEAAGKLWGVLRGKGMGETGKFWHREGYELPW